MSGWLAGCRDREPHWRYSLAGLDRGHHEVFAWGSIDKSPPLAGLPIFATLGLKDVDF